jgi:NAD(P)-dependent dehydrogenase (short-subunit alcohol dehydrogenase family)
MTTVLITGGGRGIGLALAQQFAAAGAHVVLGVRNPQDVKGFDARRLDVSDLGEVRAFAEGWTGELDILINNAGVMDVPADRTADGLDRQTATNYFGPYVLTNLLLPRLTDRVVHVASQLHRFGQLDLDDLDWRARPYRSMPAYESSKLALVLFSLELQRRLDAAGSPVRSILAHPGIARTGLAAHSRSNAINRLRPITNDAVQGARPIFYAATQDVPGNAYVGPRGPGGLKGAPAVRKAGKAGLDPARAARLWAETAALTGVG